ncbi:unnamed protein product, partial [Brassica rapa subsp. trilocularis]
TENGQNIANGVVCRKKTLNTMRMDENLLKIVRKYGERIMLKESDLLPRISKKKTRRRGGDGCPKFLLDGLAKHVRCLGIDAAVPPSKKPDSRELLDQALKENIVLLTRDTKFRFLRYNNVNPSEL